MSYDYILYEISDGIATITFNRPDKMNAMLEEMGSEIDDATNRARDDEGVRVLMITGAGKGFCAGADVSRLFRQADGTGLVHALKKPAAPVGQWSSNIYNFPKPTIAAVNGIAAGAGFSLALACDLRIASDQARMSAAWIARGIPPDTGSTWLLPRLIGLSKACEVLYLGKTLDPQEALELGIFNRVVPGDSLQKEARQLAAAIAAGPPLSLEFTKRGLKRAMESTLAEALDFETYAQRVCFETEDFKEGVRAFQEKRQPKFQGR